MQIDQVNRKASSSCAWSALFEQSDSLDISSLAPIQQRILDQLADQVKEKIEKEEVYNPSLLLESLISDTRSLSKFGKVYAKWTKLF